MATVQADYGRGFSEKVVEEMEKLRPPNAARIYRLVAVSTSFRFGMTAQEIAVALGGETNSSLKAVEMLVARKLLRRKRDGSVFVRYRVIAEVLLEHLQARGSLATIVYRLAIVAASRTSELRQSSTKAKRSLRSILNHDFLIKSMGIDTTRNLYKSLEEVLSREPHYWLRRAGFEAEIGHMSLAGNFLRHARMLAPDDPCIRTEWASFLFAQANRNSAGAATEQNVAKAAVILQQPMALKKDDTYAFQVMGSQGLTWSRRRITSREDRQKYLSRLLADVEIPSLGRDYFSTDRVEVWRLLPRGSLG